MVRDPLLWKWVKLHGSISSYKSTRENETFSCVKWGHSFLSDSPSESGDNVTPLVLTRRTLATTWENNRSWTIASYHNYSTILKINFLHFRKNTWFLKILRVQNISQTSRMCYFKVLSIMKDPSCGVFRSEYHHFR